MSRVVAGLCGAVVLMLGVTAHELSAQPQGPIKLFPDLAPAEPPSGAARTAPPGARRESGTRGPQPLAPFGREPEPEVVVEGLRAPGIDAIGLAGGLGPDFYADGDALRLVNLIQRMPLPAARPALRDLGQRLLVTGARLGEVDEPGAMLAARVQRLLAGGALDQAAALLDQVPTQGTDTPLARTAAEVALLRGDDERACLLADDVAPGSEAPFWARVVIFCRLQAGDVAGARLALDLLREAGSNDPQFLTLAEAVLDQGPGEVDLDQPPASAVQVALMRLAGIPLSEDVLSTAEPPLMAAATRSEALAPQLPLPVAERAFLLGVIDRQGLAQRYRAAAGPLPPDPLRAVRGADAAQGRAIGYAVITGGQAPADAARLFGVLWQEADGAGRLLLADLFAPVLAALPVEPGLLFAAPTLARALLAGGRIPAAARWFALAENAAPGDASAREGVAGLEPLFALAGVGGRTGVPEPDAGMLDAWRATPGAENADPALLLALFEGLGVAVPEAAWWQLAEAERAGNAALPPGAVFRALEHAREEGSRGGVALAGLHLLGEAPAAAHPEMLIDGLRALREAGLESEARAVALASAVAQGL